MSNDNSVIPFPTPAVEIKDGFVVTGYHKLSGPLALYCLNQDQVDAAVNAFKSNPDIERVDTFPAKLDLHPERRVTEVIYTNQDGTTDSELYDSNQTAIETLAWSMQSDPDNFGRASIRYVMSRTITLHNDQSGGGGAA